MRRLFSSWSRGRSSLAVALTLAALGASAGCGSCEGNDASPAQGSSPGTGQGSTNQGSTNQGSTSGSGRPPRSMPLPPTMLATPDAAP